MTAHAEVASWPRPRSTQSWLVRLFDYKPFLVFVCLLPACGLLLVFLTYPLGLGIWLAFTDTTIGRAGSWVGLENFEYLFEDRLFWQAVFYSVFYTGVATVGKFALGLWLALLLMNNELNHPGLDIIVSDITKACPMFFPWTAEAASVEVSST